MRGLAAIVSAVLLASCAGAAPRPAEVEDDGCGPRMTRLGDACWSAEGTRWRVRAEAPSGLREFEIELLAAGRVRSRDHGSASPATDEWIQAGRVLRVFLSDRFVEYRAEITNGTVLVGDAYNARGEQWAFSAQRVFGEAACRDDEARVGGTCMTVAGTRWHLSAGDTTALIEFLSGGRVASGPRVREEDRWEQEGATLRFTVGGREHVAQIASAEEIAGTFSGAQGAGTFTLTLAPSIAPAR